MLSGQNGICPVHDCVGDVLFVEKTGQDYCRYDVTFGYSHICTGRVRQEIYDRYREWARSGKETRLAPALFNPERILQGDAFPLGHEIGGPYAAVNTSSGGR